MRHEINSEINNLFSKAKKLGYPRVMQKFNPNATRGNLSVQICTARKIGSVTDVFLTRLKTAVAAAEKEVLKEYGATDAEIVDTEIMEIEKVLLKLSETEKVLDLLSEFKRDFKKYGSTKAVRMFCIKIK